MTSSGLWLSFKAACLPARAGAGAAVCRAGADCAARSDTSRRSHVDLGRVRLSGFGGGQRLQADRGGGADTADPPTAGSQQRQQSADDSHGVGPMEVPMEVPDGSQEFMLTYIRISNRLDSDSPSMKCD